MLGVNYDGLCVIMSNVTACRASCVIILGIWNDAPVFLVGACMEVSHSIIIGIWGVYVCVGVCRDSSLCYYCTTGVEVYNCIGFRRGERCLVHRFIVCIIFLFFRVWEYHVSYTVYFGGGGVHPLKCSVHPRKALLYGLGVGLVWVLGCWLVWYFDGCVAWHRVRTVALGLWRFGIGEVFFQEMSLLYLWFFC